MALLAYYNPVSSTSYSAVIWYSSINTRQRVGVRLTTPANYTWSITHVIVRLQRVGTIGEALVKITNANTYPTTTLGSKVYDVSTVTTADGGEDHQITFDSAIEVSANTAFGVTIEPNAIWSVTGVNTLQWRTNTSTQEGSFTGTNVWSSGNAAGWNDWSILSGGRRFIIEIYGTATIVGPQKVTTPSPTDEYTNMTLDWQAFSWVAGGTPPDEEVYNVYWGTELENLELIVLESPLTSVAQSYLQAVIGAGIYEETYYWRVDAYWPSTEQTAVGDVWSLSTIAFAIPAPGGRGGVSGVGGGVAADKQLNIVTRLVAFTNNKMFYEDV